MISTGSNVMGMTGSCAWMLAEHV